jgi:3-hydroxybutyryl-CoA dehydratase
MRVEPTAERFQAAADGGVGVVGETLTTRGRTITESDIVMFAGLSGDWHPQHTDAQWAATSLFGDRIAHGLLVMSIAVGLVPLDPRRVVAVRRADAVFKRPVLIGDTIHVELKVLGQQPLDGAFSILRCLWKIVNQRGQVVTKVTVNLVWREEHEHHEVDLRDRPTSEVSA